MYAVIESGGKQHRVEPGQTIRVETLAGDPGATVVFDRVLLVADGSDVRVGTPTVAGATVQGTLVEQGRGKKIAIYKFRRRQNSSRRRMGHRQNFTAVKIDAIKG